MKNYTIRKFLGIAAALCVLYGSTGSVLAAGSSSTQSTTEASSSQQTEETEKSSVNDASAAQEQSYVISYEFSPAVSAGTQITVADPDGSVIFTCTPSVSLSRISFSTEGLTEGEYTIKAGDAEDTITVTASSSKGSRDRRPFGDKEDRPSASDGISSSTPDAEASNNGSSDM